ncbi:MAG: PAS-domain containing protein, partial [Alphaproteobacteria bacterium]
VYDADIKLAAFNRQIIDLMGYPPGFLRLGMPYEEIARFKAERGDYGPGDVDEQVRKRVLNRRGRKPNRKERTWPSGMVTLMRRDVLPDGGYVSTHTDITERKKVVVALEEKTALLETTFANMAQGFAVFDASQKLVAFNDKFAEFGHFPPELIRLGTPREELLRYRAETGIFGQVDVEDAVQDRLDSAATKEFRRGEHVLADGTAFLYQRAPMPGGGVIITFTDITDRIQAEDQVRHINESLEEKVEERTAELKSAQEGLIRAERLATLGQLTGTVAHEIRNPLGAVSATAKTIELKIQDVDGLGLTDMFARMNCGIRRCDNIITELLDFARVKGLEVEPTPLDSWVTLTLGEISIPQGISIHRTLDAQGVVADFDRDRLRRVLINVVDNACQAMGEDGGELTVATRAGGDRVVITITDTGPGIPEDVLPKIFEPLFSTKQFGVGLGLPTVCQIMEEHGGGFEIANGENVGTRATLWLPLAVSLDEEKRASA